MKTKKSKIIAIMLICLILTSIMIISISAEEEDNTPIDLGEKVEDITTENGAFLIAGIYYIKITNYYNENIILYRSSNTKFAEINNNYFAQVYQGNGTTPIVITNLPYNRQTLLDGSPLYIKITLANNYNNNIYGFLTTNENNATIELYTCKNYEQGYNQGIEDYPYLQSQMNITEHITLLISRFTGQTIAPYITPIAVVLTILMVYFLFIRFLLSLIKAKGVIKVCDIVMLVGCIIILVCMYLPFVNINITNHNINDSVETTQEVYTVREDTEYDSYVRVIENETGTLYISKYGDVFIPKETEAIYKINEDIETRKITP